MSSGQVSKSGATTQLTEAQPAGGFAQAAIEATKQFKLRPAQQDSTERALKTVIDIATKDAKFIDKNTVKTLNRLVAKIDATLSKQLRAIMHDEKFLRLEGSWRGLNYLVKNTETTTDLQIKVLCCTKQELANDLEMAEDYDRSVIYNQIYRKEFGTAGGNPYAAIVGDYQIENNADDLGMLSEMSRIAAAGFCPFLTSPASSLFGLETWEELPKPGDLKLQFTGPKYTKWHAFRKSEDSRFVAMTFPRVLAREMYGVGGKKVQDFNYQEVEVDADGETALGQEHQHFCWMNAAYALATRITTTFAKSGFCVNILGYGSDSHGGGEGGKLEDLPVFAYREVDGLLEMKCPTELNIDDQRANEIGQLGFIPLIHWQRSNTAAFITGDTVNLPKKYNQDDATLNAQASAWLPHMLAAGRFSHLLKVIGREMLGRSLEPEDVESHLNTWIKQYVCEMSKPSEKVKAELPLKEARVEVSPSPDEYGHYFATVHMVPWTPLRQLTASMRMVAQIPKKAGG